jgi:hypothetical protein
MAKKSLDKTLNQLRSLVKERDELKAEVKRMKRVYKTAMKLYHECQKAKKK